MLAAGIPTGVWALNVAASAIGLSLAASMELWPGPARPLRRSAWWGALLVVPALLGATLLAQDVEGVHRWLRLGPIQIHAAAVLLPPLLVALLEAPWKPALVGAGAVLVLLMLQPDAAQAAAFCAAWIGIVAVRQEEGGAAVVAASVAVAVAAVFRPDPLEPVPHVEGIVGMAASQGSSLPVVALVSLAVLPLAQAFLLERSVGLVLATYTAVLLMAAWLGHHPVPVLGYGVSPILGYYGAVGMAFVLGRVGEGPASLPAAAV